MGKNMAKVENGLVTNILWCPDRQARSDSLIDIADRPVGVGDSFDGADFYRDGEKVLTALEQTQLQLADAAAALEVLGVSP